MLLAAFVSVPGGLTWSTVWFWLLLLIGLVWLRRHFDLNRARTQPFLAPADADGAAPLPRLTVLVAAKDEEPNIEHCLAGLLTQEYPALEVVAIDDRSTDTTGAVIERMAGCDSRLKPVHVSALPAGWTGKNHAMHVGAQHATGELLCFTDADCRFHSPQLLAAAVRLALRKNAEFLSVMPELEAHGFWEKLVQPPAGGIMVFWFPPEKVNDPQRPQAYANGAFMLLTRAAYDRLGGHAALRTSMNEDMHLAHRAKAAGVRLYVIPGGGMYTVRMYTGLRAIWNGWTRIFYGSFGTWPRLTASAVFLLIFSLLPIISLPLALLGGSAGPAIALAALWALAAQQTVMWRFYRLCSVPRAWALAYPFGAALCLAIILNTMRRRATGRMEWRGTTYHGAPASGQQTK